MGTISTISPPMSSTRSSSFRIPAWTILRYSATENRRVRTPTDMVSLLPPFYSTQPSKERAHAFPGAAWLRRPHEPYSYQPPGTRQRPESDTLVDRPPPATQIRMPDPSRVKWRHAVVLSAV